MHRLFSFFVAIVVGASTIGSAGAGYVLPNLGGGQGNASMKHADITLVGTSLSVHIDPTVPIPLLRPLTSPDEFNPAMPWSVLQDKAHNFQYGWNASGYWAPPPGTAVWIEQLDASPGLEVYYVSGLPASLPYDPIFGTDGSSAAWKWDGFMTHNAYAILNPTESIYEATYKVYIGDQNTGAETAGYDSAEVTFQFEATPILTADFNDDASVDDLDLAIWGQHYGMSGEATNSMGDANYDANVDGLDLLAWQRQFSNGQTPNSSAAILVPEPASLGLLALSSIYSLCRRRRLPSEFARGTLRHQ